MGCPYHHGNSDGSEGSEGTDDLSGSGDSAHHDRGVDRRTFVKTALAIGGTGALSQLQSVAALEPSTSDPQRDRLGAGPRSNRQHAWDAFESTAASGNTAPPPNSVFLCLNYAEDGEPSPEHRRRVEDALRAIEHTFEWHREGVVFTMAYSAAYFDRFDEDLPPGAAPFPPDRVASLAEAVTTDDEVEPDTHDALLLLASNNAANLLAVEEALWGNDDGVDGSFDATFEGIFERPREFPHRRVGFAGTELPRDDYYDDLHVDVPDDAPLSMGFIAGFGASIPGEDAVTLERDQRFPGPGIDADDVPDAPYVGEVGTRDPGMFAQGTLKHVSHVELDLESWYAKPHEERRTQMYSPFHTDEDVGEVGESLTDPQDGRPGAHEGGDGDEVPDLRAVHPDQADYASRAEETAAAGTPETDGTPVLGHSQKAARARYDVDGDGELEQPVLRRDWDTIVTEDEPTAGYHFNVPMRFNESVFSMFEANYNLEFTSLDGRIDHGPVETEAWRERNGIAPFMEATFRGHYLVPPISLRALPTPRPERVDLRVRRDDDTYVVSIDDDRRWWGRDHGRDGLEAIDEDTVQFGAPAAVDAARGATPSGTNRRWGSTQYVFDADDVDADDEVRFFAKREGSRRPVVGSTSPSDDSGRGHRGRGWGWGPGGRGRGRNRDRDDSDRWHGDDVDDGDDDPGWENDDGSDSDDDRDGRWDGSDDPGRGNGGESDGNDRGRGNDDDDDRSWGDDDNDDHGW